MASFGEETNRRKEEGQEANARGEKAESADTNVRGEAQREKPVTRRRKLILKAPLTDPPPLEIEVPWACVEKSDVQDGVNVYQIKYGLGEDEWEVCHRFSALHALNQKLKEFMATQPPLVEAPFVPLPGIPGPLKREPPPFPPKKRFSRKTPQFLAQRVQNLSSWLDMLFQFHEFLENEEMVKDFVSPSVFVGQGSKSPTSADEKGEARAKAEKIGCLLMAGAEIRRLRKAEGLEHNEACERLAKEKGLLF